jgi:hypothetical protein
MAKTKDPFSFNFGANAKSKKPRRKKAKGSKANAWQQYVGKTRRR